MLLKAVTGAERHAMRWALRDAGDGPLNPERCRQAAQALFRRVLSASIRGLSQDLEGGRAERNAVLANNWTTWYPRRHRLMIPDGGSTCWWGGRALPNL